MLTSIVSVPGAAASRASDGTGALGYGRQIDLRDDRYRATGSGGSAGYRTPDYAAAGTT